LGLVGQRHLPRERWSAPTRAAVRSFSLVLRTLFCKVLQLSIYEMPPPDFLTRPSRAPSPVQDFRASRWRAVACSAGGDGGGFTSAILVIATNATDLRTGFVGFIDSEGALGEDYARDKLTNGSKTLPDTDGRLRIARRFRDIAAAILVDQGGAEL